MLRNQNGQVETLLKFPEALEAINAVIINAVWAADIDRHFNSFPTNVGWNRLDEGIVRFCQQATLLWTASLFDRDSRATSLKYFLNVANDNSARFANTGEEQIKATVATHLAWIEKNAEKINEIKDFRDKQIAHLDRSSVKAYFDGEIAGVKNIFGSTVVEKAAELLKEVINIVNFYNRALDGKELDLDAWREKIKKDCGEYIQCRSN